MSEQDYIPGTYVIRNLVRRDADGLPYGTTDQQVLYEAENFYIPTRLAELLNGEAPLDASVKPFSFAHMRGIHHHLFQDVYAWAGEPRRVPMSKLGTPYAEPAEMNGLLRGLYASLAEQDHLRGIEDQREFTSRLAGFWAEINHAHAFREGNTRSQTVFFEQLARHAGWSLEVARLSPHHPSSVYQEFVDARFEHQRLRDTNAHDSTAANSTSAALSAREAARELASVLYGLVEADRSPEGVLRRGKAASGVEAGHVADQAVRPGQGVIPAPTPVPAHLRHPELRGMKLDPYGLADDTENESSAGGYEL